MGWPEREVVLQSVTQPVESVELLGYRGQMRWQQNRTGLRVPLPPVQPTFS